ncbi:anthranilate phosphoribosyltransferase [Candidatus Formimonas warabiya]|uniref:Anthranilate phosphoribosyltransferase n=1 Tax=Formimonas warabiya TaxID=1761012 RepID=A0A3G1KWJ2_FORW1|nr:anthranilate phosphoribosyltransferase [Candidatus Formimonas warabiya]ATW26790.1 anthranilate phosphoribosyltransferase [Candidatus Formimonas warabiya]
MPFEKARQFGSVITKLINSQNITREESKEMFYQILQNEQTDMHQGAFLAALTAKGETAEEIAGSWEAIYELDTVKVVPCVDAPLVDNCGTGMDSLKTFNISTAASIIAAAAGIPMAKHGARAITSVCGTVDILEELGIDVECDPEVVKQSIEKAGIGIFNGMSPKVHPQALGRILSQISFGTVLNIAASLANPALPKYGVRGVYAKEMLGPVAEVMKEIGYQKALVVHGLSDDGVKGMDEASTLGETFIAELKENGEIIHYSFLPEEMGIARAKREDVTPLSDRTGEAVRLIAVINGSDAGARSDIVCLNAALILYLMYPSTSIKEGYEQAKEIIRSGKAMDKLRAWVQTQNLEPLKGLSKLEELVKQAGEIQ